MQFEVNMDGFWDRHAPARSPRCNMVATSEHVPFVALGSPVTVDDMLHCKFDGLPVSCRDCIGPKADAFTDR